MAKECSVCKTINHSAANHCTTCGNELPDKELSVEEQLRIELHETKKTKEILEKALTDVQKGIFPEVEKKNIEIRLLQEKLVASKKETIHLHSEKQKLEETLLKVKNDLKIAVSPVKTKTTTKIVFYSIIGVLTLIITVVIVSYERKIGNALEIIGEIKENNEEKLEIVTRELETAKDNMRRLQEQSGMSNLTDIMSLITGIEVKNFKVIRNDNVQFIYSGIMRNNLPNGYGMATYIDGKSYEGNFMNGYRSGNGTLTFSSGEVYKDKYLKNKYTGHFVKDNAEGLGEILFHNGYRLVGDFENNEPQSGTVYDERGVMRYNGSRLVVFFGY